MKRFIALLLILLMALSPVTALAAGEDSIRHEVTGDVSEFEVGEEVGSGKMNEGQTEATMGTDLYLFVDPDTASYITFVVTDEQGKPLEGAQIYIEYNGKSELFGTTDKDGKLSTYLFRDTEYGYTVKKTGYETVEGSFTATEETKTIRVVMREYFDLNIFVVDGDKPVQGVKVLLDGYGSYTDDEGKTTYERTNGVYTIEVITDDGRRIVTQAVVNGDTDIIIDISEDDSIVPGGRYTDRFLVYDRNYDPEDYVLTKYLFSEDDLGAEEEAEDYLAANPNTIHIAAQPDRRQNADGTDTDITTDVDGDTKKAYTDLFNDIAKSVKTTEDFENGVLSYMEEYEITEDPTIANTVILEEDTDDEIINAVKGLKTNEATVVEAEDGSGVYLVFKGNVDDYVDFFFNFADMMGGETEEATTEEATTDTATEAVDTEATSDTAEETTDTETATTDTDVETEPEYKLNSVTSGLTRDGLLYEYKDAEFKQYVEDLITKYQSEISINEKELAKYTAEMFVTTEE